MRTVRKDFFCVIEKVTYKKGDSYKGNREDLEHVLEPIKKEKVLTPRIETKPIETPEAPQKIVKRKPRKTK